jgi:hypothetical protein
MLQTNEDLNREAHGLAIVDWGVHPVIARPTLLPGDYQKIQPASEKIVKGLISNLTWKSLCWTQTCKVLTLPKASGRFFITGAMKKAENR